MPQRTLIVRFAQKGVPAVERSKAKVGPQKHCSNLPLNLSPMQRVEDSHATILFESFTLLLLFVCCVCLASVSLCVVWRSEDNLLKLIRFA